MLDEQVPKSVQRVLWENGYEADYIRDYVVRGSVDPLVAAVAERHQAILVSLDADFRKIRDRLPSGTKNRFKKLSRLCLTCTEPEAAGRLRQHLDFLDFELEKLRTGERLTVTITIGTSYIRAER